MAIWLFEDANLEKFWGAAQICLCIGIPYRIWAPFFF